VTTRTRRGLTMEILEERVFLSAIHGASVATAIPPGSTLTVLNEFTQHYPSIAGQPRYNPAFDLNHNGQIGQTDGKILLDSLAPVSPKVPLTLNVILAPRDQVHGHVPTNSGGETYSKDPTILGHTTPGALIFTGTGVVDLKLRGPAVVADAQGNFSLKVNLTTGIDQFDFQAVTRYGQQTLRAFPILWMGFAKYANAHPVKD
jgi:hypothetical protein